MPVIANTTPLILLAKRGIFHLLHCLYGSILLPLAVWREVVEQGAGRAGEQETVAARAAGWIEVRALQHPEVAQWLSDTSGLGPGESEVIALAQECAAELLLLDDDQAVKRARESGLVVRRTPGVLGLAKAQGLITTVQEHLDALRAEGLWLSVEVYYRVLRDVGEESRQ
jgi:uncharacterized protein